MPRQVNRMLLLLLLLAALPGACGKKGRLYIPPAPAEAVPVLPGAGAVSRAADARADG